MNRGRPIYVLALIAIVSLLFISGCVTAPPEAAPTPAATPMPTPSPTPSGVSVEILTAPDTAAAGKSFVVTWRVNSPVQKNITHTAVHYGSEPRGEPLTLASYPSLTTPKSGTIPSEFSTGLVLNTTGVTYFRAHAIVDGTHVYSPEYRIAINPRYTGGGGGY